jgi:hypothetical protein
VSRIAVSRSIVNKRDERPEKRGVTKSVLDRLWENDMERRKVLPSSDHDFDQKTLKRAGHPILGQTTLATLYGSRARAEKLICAEINREL